MEEVENEKQQFTLIVLYKTDRRKSSTSVKAELQTELSITISQTTIRRRAHEIGLYGRVARKKPYLNKANRGKQLEYARTYREKPLNLWNGRMKANSTYLGQRRSTKEELEPRCTVPTVKHGRGKC